MLKGRQILSLPVVTLHEKKQVGEVKDLIYDPGQNVLLGYLVEIGGWLKGGKGFLHTDLLRHDEDSLVIRDESVVREVSTIPQLKQAMDRKEDVRGMRVEYADGRTIGIIQDLVVDWEAGKITGYEVSDGIIQDLLDGRITIPNRGIEISPDKVVAPSETDTDTSLKGESL